MPVRRRWAPLRVAALSAAVALVLAAASYAATAQALAVASYAATAQYAAAAPATAALSRGDIVLPTPARAAPALPGIGLTRDRLLVSRAPGPVDDREDVTVLLGPDGAPATVTVDQRLDLTGTGDYAIRERGPARAAVAKGDTVPPVLKLGTVVWQGFVPGRRTLEARLTLDAGLEAARVPLAVTLAFRDRTGRPSPLAAGGRAPADGVLTVTLANQTGSSVNLPGGRAEPSPLARALDDLRGAALHPRPGSPPVPGAGLPRAVPGTPSPAAPATVVAPLRVTGTVRVPGATAAVSGPGTTPLADGARLSGVLQGTAAFEVPLHRGEAVAVDLDVQPWLDPRPLQPPNRCGSWAAWAAAGPSAGEVTDATSLLVRQTAAAARGAEFTPYLGADVHGRSVTTFRYRIAPAAAVPVSAHRLRPRPVGIAATGVAVLAILANAALLRRRL